MIIVGVVGGIGSGKSAVCRWVSNHDPSIRVIDADRDGHRALELPAVKQALQTAFGRDILGADGKLIRSAIASRVFGDSPESQDARRKLEAIVHPAIAKLRDDQLAELSSNRTIRAVLVDAGVYETSSTLWKIIRIKDSRTLASTDSRKSPRIEERQRIRANIRKCI